MVQENKLWNEFKNSAQKYVQTLSKKDADYFKSGGRLIGKYKKGSGINIKPENKGKFTDYCGGKVTSECIQKGKNSSNPTTRKRATFAANARKWKHESGGSMQVSYGKKVHSPKMTFSVLDTNKDMALRSLDKLRKKKKK